ncbi:MAG: hypothetical protein RLY31_2602 [Bacteroidota bacterium]|jgi:ABC-type Mn2+/Zn2+ transport system ATPase subunit
MHPISIQGLSVSYDKKIALTNIFLEVRERHIYGVVGPNGAGKSTLFKAILGLIPAHAGTVRIFGKPLAQQRKRIAYVPQKDDIDWQFPATVLDVVLMGRYPFKKIFQRINASDRKAAMEALELTGMAAFRSRRIGELSGGQQQRVFLARALCQDAAIYLLDEPFAGVDLTTEEHIIGILKELAACDRTLMVIHHDLSTVPSYFDQVILVNQRLVAAGATASTFTDSNIARTFGGQLPVLHRSRLA